LLDGVSAEFFCLDLLREFRALLRTEVFAAFSLLAILVAASSSFGTKYPSSSKLLSISPWKARLTASPMSPRPAGIRGLDHDSLCILLDGHNAVQRMLVFLYRILVTRQVDHKRHRGSASNNRWQYERRPIADHEIERQLVGTTAVPRAQAYVAICAESVR
jgi:hypothetical protein